MNAGLSRLTSSFWFVTAGLTLLSLVIYWPCLNGPFLFDDNEWIVELEWAYQSLEGLRRLWLEPGTSQQYYPLTATTFWIDHQLWGLNTLPYHIENVLLHGFCGGLFWRLLKQLQVRGAGLAALLFITHPMMVESVAFITERRNVLCQALMLGACLAYGRSLHRWSGGAAPRVWSWYWLALILFIAAVLAKITAFVFPAAVLVITWWKTGGIQWRRDVLPALPLFAVSIAAGLGIKAMEDDLLGTFNEVTGLPFSSRLMLAGQVLWFYIGKLLWPHPVCVIYHRWNLDPSLWWQWAPLAACLAAALLLCWKRDFMWWRGTVAAALLYAGMLFPLLGFLNVAGMLYSWVADRWVYMPALPAFAGLGHLCATLRRPGFTAGAVAAGVLAVLSWKQAAAYSSMDGFWQAAIASNANPWKARSDYADALIANKRYAEAEEQLRLAIDLQPGSSHPYCNLGVALLSLGRTEEALQALQKAAELQPGSSLIHYNQANAYFRLGRFAEMEQQLRLVLELQPDAASAHADLGNVLFKTGRLAEAAEHYQKALRQRPENPGFMSSLGSILFQQGRRGEAIDLFKQALVIDPHHVTALVNYATALINPADPALHNSQLAVELARKAAELTGLQDTTALKTLAMAHAMSGQFLEAAEAARTAAKAADARGMPELAAQFRQLAAAYAEGRMAP